MMTKTRTTLVPTGYGRCTRPTSLVARILTFLSINRERHHLNALDDHLLRDIGLTRDEAETEAKRSAWDAPERWLR